MSQRGSGIGMVLLVVVLLVVLLLVARSWRSVAPEAIDVGGLDAGLAPAADDHGEVGAGEALQQGRLPDMQEMRSQTAAHGAAVQDALAAIE